MVCQPDLTKIAHFENQGKGFFETLKYFPDDHWEVSTALIDI